MGRTQWWIAMYFSLVPYIHHEDPFITMFSQYQEIFLKKIVIFTLHYNVELE